MAFAEDSIDAFATHLERPLAKGHTPERAITGAAGGAACGDLIRISLVIDGKSLEGRILDVGFDAHGCGASIAAGSATVALVRGQPLLDAARVGSEQIAGELGGLSEAKLHAAELASDALHRALGLAARRQARLADSDARAVVAMSGGVDSAVAALLTMRGGAEAVGVTLELWADEQNDAQRSCCSAQAVRSARSLAHSLGLPHLSIDLREEFRAGVVEPWLADHAAGLTPYPCVRCNGEVRLDGMLELAQRLGSQTLVTGHYARVADVHMCTSGESRMRDSRGSACAPPGSAACGAAADIACDVGPPAADPLLQVAVDEGKDQSYALASLAPGSLARLRFPLGGMRKQEVRALAREAGLVVARRPDSQDLCFLAGTDQRAFLARHGGLGARSGEIVDPEGEVLGGHQGAHGFTIGQRRGLGLGGGEPRFVLATDIDANTVTVGPRERLHTREVEVRDVTLRRDGGCVDAVKIRYRGRRLGCTIQNAAAGSHERLLVKLSDPIERTAPGQLACLYCGDLLVGHGTIVANAAASG
ncbi:MAG TPA: iron-sulfur cluster assembly scaffold protein [Solirubrobacteraceae bacterium]|jgi:tRNA-specific 2-thiouridylase